MKKFKNIQGLFNRCNLNLCGKLQSRDYHMRMIPMTGNRLYISIGLLIIVCTGNVMHFGSFNAQRNSQSQHSQIHIVQEEVSLFGGVNSIRAVLGSSQIGVLYSTPKNPQPLYIFTIFTQKVAKVEILNRRGTLENRTELVIRNIFLFSLDNIIEFEDSNNDSRLNYLNESTFYRMLRLSTVDFKIQKYREYSNDSESHHSYQLSFSASNVKYQNNRGNNDSPVLENLSFMFELEMSKDRISIPKIPTISIQPHGRELVISVKDYHRNIKAERLVPRLKFSCNISGWDYTSRNSKLLLKVTTLAHEFILNPFKPIARVQVTRETLKSTNLLGRLKFETDQEGQHNLDHNDNSTTNYTNRVFINSQFSLGNSLREFLSFTWNPMLMVDGNEAPAIFQPLSSLERKIPLNPTKPSIQTPALELKGGFIFPQGSEIVYDPEVQIEELNPLLQIISVPNRSILLDNSRIILILGFFVGIVIVIRQRPKR